jgi:hypothetical protein
MKSQISARVTQHSLRGGAERSAEQRCEPSNGARIFGSANADSGPGDAFLALLFSRMWQGRRGNWLPYADSRSLAPRNHPADSTIGSPHSAVLSAS